MPLSVPGRRSVFDQVPSPRARAMQADGLAVIAARMDYEARRGEALRRQNGRIHFPEFGGW